MDTKLFSRRQPGGFFAVTDREIVPSGTIWWVSSGTGTDGAGYGRNPDAPLATLDYAIGLCTASVGDIIYLMPGHAETLTGATSCVVDVAGINIIGLGAGSLVPTFTLGTATSAIISVTAANVRIRNIKIISNLANVAVGLNFGADADGGVVENCQFYDGASNKELTIMLNIEAGCNNMRIVGNRFIGDVGSDDTNAILLAGASNYTEIIGNYVHGKFTAAPIAASAAASTSLIIADNCVNNAETGAGLTITAHASTTGIAVRNLCLGAKDTVHLVLAAMMVAENYDSNAAGASAIIKPAVDS